MTIAAEIPAGERFGPYIFWAVLILLIAVLVWALIKRARPARRGPSKEAGTRPEDYREHHRVEWTQPPAEFTPTTAHWPLAVAAVFSVCADGPWDSMTFRRLEDPREGLAEAWAIRSRSQLLSRLHWILREGHRVGFASEVNVWSEASTEPADGRVPVDAWERGWAYNQVLVDARGIRDVKFEAWDLVRAAMLTRAGYSLGWLTEDETIDTMNLLSAELQATYAGWEEMGDHFLRARWYWSQNTGLELRQEDAHDASRQAALLEPESGPWAHVPWRMPLPDSRVLLVDALVDAELVTEVPASALTPLARRIDAATAERLAARP